MASIEPDDKVTEVTHWFNVTDVDPVTDRTGHSFQPTRLVVTFRTFHTTATGEIDGPEWRAKLVGPIIRKDGTPSKRETDERYWETHYDVPDWLREHVATIR